MKNFARKGTIALLLLLAISAISISSVAAQKNGGKKGGGGGGGGGGCSYVWNQGQSINTATGLYTETFQLWCNGTPVSGFPVVWNGVYNFGANSCTISSTGASCVGSVQSIQLSTDSTGMARLTLYPSQPSGSWYITAVP